MYSALVNNFEQWRAAARRYVAAEVSPEQIQWLSDQQGGLFEDIEPFRLKNTATENVTVPANFISRVKQASHYIGRMPPETKWPLFYSLLWRITKIDRRIMTLKSDSQVQQLDKMIKSVNRDMHKMKAFLRFKSEASLINDLASDTTRDTNCTDKHYTAWFEPEHAIIEPISPFFVKRFTGMSWSILTPHGCAHWNQKELIQSPGISRPDIRDDEFDHFWRAYYRSIFNPARLKEQAMRSEMPKKYWKYLPESICIKDLATNAATRVDAMADADCTSSERVRQRSKRVTGFQDTLRQENKL